MKHSNNMRERVTRMDNAEAAAKRAAEVKRGAANMDNNPDRIEIGTGASHPGAGVNSMVGPAERLAPYDSKKAIDQGEGAIEGTSGQKKDRKKSSWIKGSSESKRIGGDHNIKGKL